jgi:hypothetical protein
MSELMTVTLPVETFDALRDQVKKLQADLAQAMKERDDAVINNPASGGFGESVLQVLRVHALPIIQFAVAELHPENVRGWPHNHLAALATFMANHPVASQLDKEMAMAFEQFCSECKALEMARKWGVEKEIAKFPLSSLGGGYEKLVMSLVQEKLEKAQALPPSDEKKDEKVSADAGVAPPA